MGSVIRMFSLLFTGIFSLALQFVIVYVAVRIALAHHEKKKEQAGI